MNTFNPLTALFSFQGRMPQSHFWAAWGIVWIYGLATGVLAWFGGLLLIPVLWANTAIAVKRLHDLDRSGWLALVPTGIMLLAGVYMFVRASLSSAFVGGIDTTNMEQGWYVWGSVFLIPMIGCLAGFLFMLWLGIRSGTRGPNRFGPDPRARLDPDRTHTDGGIPLN